MSGQALKGAHKLTGTPSSMHFSMACCVRGVSSFLDDRSVPSTSAGQRGQWHGIKPASQSLSGFCQACRCGLCSRVQVIPVVTCRKMEMSRDPASKCICTVKAGMCQASPSQSGALLPAPCSCIFAGDESAF